MIRIIVVDTIMTPQFVADVDANYLVPFGNKVFVVGDKRHMYWADFKTMNDERFI